MDDGSSPLWAILIFLLFIIINGILYGFGSAIQKVSESEIEKRLQKDSKKTLWIMDVIDNPAIVVNTILTCGTLLSMMAGYAGVRGFGPHLYTAIEKIAVFSYVPKPVLHVLCIIVVILFVLVVLVAIGIISAKKIFTAKPEVWVFRTASTVRLLVKIFYPVTFFIVVLANMIIRLLGMDPHRNEEDVTEEEIISMVDDAHEQGVIEENEAEMIQNIMEFSDTEAQDIMTHRKNIHAISEDTTLMEALSFMLNGVNSRYPVYREDIDDIIGILHLKDAMKQITFEKNGEIPICRIPNLIREASYIPETRSINDLFKRMQAKKIHMAVVVDEYGQTSGIVTMEDILEEIVGNILDEYDEDDHFIIEQHDDTYLMQGLTPLEEAGAVLNVDFDDEDYETLNGYLTSLLGHIPNIEEDKEVKANGYLFTILAVENNTIQKVRVEKLPEIKGEEKCQDIQNSLT